MPSNCSISATTHRFELNSTSSYMIMALNQSTNLKMFISKLKPNRHYRSCFRWRTWELIGFPILSQNLMHVMAKTTNHIHILPWHWMIESKADHNVWISAACFQQLFPIKFYCWLVDNSLRFLPYYPNDLYLFSHFKSKISVANITIHNRNSSTTWNTHILIEMTWNVAAKRGKLFQLYFR